MLLITIFRCFIFLYSKSSHQVTYRGFSSLVKVYMGFFKAVVTTSGSGIVNNLVQTVISQEPIKCCNHFFFVLFFFKYLIKFA